MLIICTNHKQKCKASNKLHSTINIVIFFASKSFPTIGHKPLIMKQAFSKEFSQKLIEYYGRMPSASVVSRDFNLRAKEVSPISQETARRWIRSISIPEMEKLQVLVEWLNLDLRFLTNPSNVTANDNHKTTLTRHKGLLLDPLEAFLIKSFKETDLRGKHCLLRLAKSLHEKPSLNL